jgi:hypothetical protein
MKFKIKKGVPLPRRSSRPIKYDLPLDKMEIGDHIFIELPVSKISREIKIIRNAVDRFKTKRQDTNFSVMKLDNGVGIWRK